MENEEVETLLCLELVGNVLHEAGELDVVLLVGGAAKGRQGREPQGDGGAVVAGALLLRIGERFQDAEAQHVVREVRQVLERVDDGSDEVVVDLNLR